jgi:hypothetical protein
MNYKIIYESLCEKAKFEYEYRIERKNNHNFYYEGHHILPKCLGGKGKYGDYKHENIVLLTAKEHFIAHLLLCEIYPKSDKLKMAVYSMCNQNKNGVRYRVSSRTYERLKIQYIKILKTIPKTQQHLEAIKQAINKPSVKKAKSDKLKNVKKTEDHINNLKKRWQNEETRIKIVESMKKAYENDKVRDNRTSAILANEKIRSSPDVTCPHCNKIGKRAYLAPHHFNRCKALRT